MPLQIIRQDITKMRVDAIVNTTNRDLIGYSGVDLAVHTAAGSGLDEECAQLPPLGLGQAVVTDAYNLPCKYIIHTSGPVWRGGSYGEDIVLRSCYLESLKLAVKLECESVALPLISSGVYGFPKDQVLKFAVQTITEFLFENDLLVYLCVFDKESYSFSQKLFHDIRDFIGDTHKVQHEAVPRENSAPDLPIQAQYCANEMLQIRRRPPSANKESLHEYVHQLDKSFQEKLFALIDQSGMTDVECYKKANVDKRTFSKIKSNPNYRPSKQTAIAFAISLQLDLAATQDLLATVGYTLSSSQVFDQIIRYFILHQNYDIFQINEALFEFDQALLGGF